MKKLLFALTVLLFMCMSFPGVAQQECPEDSHVCLQEDRAKRFLEAGEDMRCLQRQLEEDDIEVTGEPYRIIVDEDGRVFSDDKMTFHVKWCEFDLELQHDPELDVHRKTEQEDPWGMHLRIRLGAGFNFIPHDDASYSQPRSLIEPLLLVESFYWKFLHAEAHFGLHTFGVGVGVDITENFDVYGGAGLRWMDLSQVTPVLGASLSFN